MQKSISIFLQDHTSAPGKEGFQHIVLDDVVAANMRFCQDQAKLEGLLPGAEVGKAPTAAVGVGIGVVVVGVGVVVVVVVGLPSRHMFFGIVSDRDVFKDFVSKWSVDECRVLDLFGEQVFV